MAYSLSQSELRTNTTSIGDYDAPGKPETGTAQYYLAPDNIGMGYGATIPVNYAANYDYYSLGELAPGVYELNVDKYKWDSTNYTWGSFTQYGVTSSIGKTYLVLHNLVQS